jgi:rubrerythrin
MKNFIHRFVSHRCEMDDFTIMICPNCNTTFWGQSREECPQCWDDPMIFLQRFVDGYQ